MISWSFEHHEVVGNLRPQAWMWYSRTQIWPWEPPPLGPGHTHHSFPVSSLSTFLWLECVIELIMSCLSWWRLGRGVCLSKTFNWLVCSLLYKVAPPTPDMWPLEASPWGNVTLLLKKRFFAPAPKTMFMFWKLKFSARTSFLGVFCSRALFLSELLDKAACGKLS